MSDASEGGAGVREASWERDSPAMIAIREAVFVVEQGVPVEIEIDGRDPACAHVLALDHESRSIGTARMLPSGHIGRIAVVREWRERGVGSLLVAALLEQARRSGLSEVDLDSQTHAIGFYEKLGFEVRGEEFMEAGIAHQNMVLRLARGSRRT